MSYCRFSDDSDVYLYATIGGGFSVHLTTGFTKYKIKSAEEALAFIQEQKASGLKVPDYAIERLEREIAEGK